MVPKRVLCTGGAGYIGSHTVLKLIDAGYSVDILDNFSNSAEGVVVRMQQICGKQIEVLKIDVTKKDALVDLFRVKQYDAVVHFASRKAVNESISMPLNYYETNVTGSINLFQAMKACSCRVLLFSSSAAVYDCSKENITETTPVKPCNPYGRTKIMIETILEDLCEADDSFHIISLRYFNPIGAHKSGKLGESPHFPSNLLPYIQQVAVGRLAELKVFGQDWPTPDGTGVRDYIHVEDLADGHVAALKKLMNDTEKPIRHAVYNLGTGRGTSVMELLQCFERACRKKLPYTIANRRPGDVGSLVADPSKAERDLGWKASLTIDEACSSAWLWQSTNPYGYSSAPADAV